MVIIVSHFPSYRIFGNTPKIWQHCLVCNKAYIVSNLLWKLLNIFLITKLLTLLNIKWIYKIKLPSFFNSVRSTKILKFIYQCSHLHELFGNVLFYSILCESFFVVIILESRLEGPNDCKFLLIKFRLTMWFKISNCIIFEIS